MLLKRRKIIFDIQSSRPLSHVTQFWPKWRRPKQQLSHLSLIRIVNSSWIEAYSQRYSAVDWTSLMVRVSNIFFQELWYSPDVLGNYNNSIPHTHACLMISRGDVALYSTALLVYECWYNVNLLVFILVRQCIFHRSKSTHTNTDIYIGIQNNIYIFLIKLNIGSLN